MKKTFIALLVAFGSATMAQIPTAGLMKSWEFTGTLNDGTGGDHGVWSGTGAANYVADRCGNNNSAIALNGTNQYIQMGGYGPLGGSARSISFWMKTSAPSNLAPKAFICYGKSTPLQVCGPTSFEIDYDYGCKGTGPDICKQQITWKNNCLYDGNWHHIVATYAANNTIAQIKIYVDAILMTTTCGFGNLVLDTQTDVPIRIGSSGEPTPSRFFGGSLDDFYMYNVVLSQADIDALFADKCALTACISTTVNPPPPPPKDGCCLGNKCTDSKNPLAGNYEIPLNKFDFNFSGDDEFFDKVNVGYNCNLSDIGKFNTITGLRTNRNSGGPESVSIYGKNIYNSPGAGTGVGVMGEAFNHEGSSIGVWGNAMGDGDNTGGNFYAGSISGNQLPNTHNIGVSGVARPSTGTPPPYSYTASYPFGANIGVYGAGAIGNTPPGPNPPPGSAGPDWAGWFDGDVNVMGSCWNNAVWIFSDKRLKKDIKSLENVSERIKKLNAYNYSFRTDEFSKRGFDNRTHIGFIAQEIKEVFPELIREDALGFMGVDYQGMIPVLLQATKEQQSKLDQQQQQIDELKSLVQSLAGATPGGEKTNQTSAAVTLSDKNVVVLNQNVPNPFAQSTVITYNIPEDFSKAQIIFTNNQGIVIRAVDIRTKGKGSLSVFADDLTNGSYSYALIVDGKHIDSKKMIKQ